MSKSLEDYKQQYSLLVELSVKLHNYHHAFSTHWGAESGRMLRQTARKLRQNLKVFGRISEAAQNDYKVIRKELEKKKKEDELAWRLANPKKKGRPKGKNKCQTQQNN